MLCQWTVGKVLHNNRARGFFLGGGGRNTLIISNNPKFQDIFKSSNIKSAVVLNAGRVFFSLCRYEVINPNLTHWVLSILFHTVLF